MQPKKLQREISTEKHNNKNKKKTQQPAAQRSIGRVGGRDLEHWRVARARCIAEHGVVEYFAPDARARLRVDKRHLRVQRVKTHKKKIRTREHRYYETNEMIYCYLIFARRLEANRIDGTIVLLFFEKKAVHKSNRSHKQIKAINHADHKTRTTFVVKRVARRLEQAERVNCERADVERERRRRRRRSAAVVDSGAGRVGRRW